MRYFCESNDCVLFWEHAPAVMGIPEAYQHLPLVIAPIVYALLWHYAVKPLNELLGLQDF